MTFSFKRLLQDFELLQGFALCTAVAKFEALAVGQFLNGQCGLPTKKFAHLSSNLQNELLVFNFFSAAFLRSL